ncbi:histone deacetylase [Thermoleophilum album]|uniref:histone deacetylase family protein n=1 Tax=Thermoleophilum album TaxID=29539 RepID=UPI00237D214B|nr:histone deacetylase [Thermoleophilum album]WDT93118.1 histone deacetylase [Thermoleophilum album]
MSILYFHHEASHRHDTGFGHPERVERIVAVEERVAALADTLPIEHRRAPVASEEQLLRVHTPRHLEAVRRHVASGVPLDVDTPVSAGSLEAALAAAGGACALAEALLAGDAARGFAALRPPGHHAEPERAMGFCLFNNVACAAAHALALGCERVAIVDWDVHHGNGTCEAFRSSRDVLFASIHQWPFYPGTGALDDVGDSAGRGYTVNLPVPAQSGGDLWRSLVAHVVVPALFAFEPQLILVSAGYDAHRADPIGGCLLAADDYSELALLLDAAARELGAPLGFVLEGGYDLDALAASVAATLVAVARPHAPAPVALHPAAAAARERLQGIVEFR